MGNYSTDACLSFGKSDCFFWEIDFVALSREDFFGSEILSGFNCEPFGPAAIGVCFTHVTIYSSLLHGFRRFALVMHYSQPSVCVCFGSQGLACTGTFLVVVSGGKVGFPSDEKAHHLLERDNDETKIAIDQRIVMRVMLIS